MSKFIMSISLLSGNFLFQFMQEVPDYLIAFEYSYFMAVGMLFITFYPKFVKWINK